MSPQPTRCPERPAGRSATKQRVEAGRKIGTPELDGRRWTDFP